MVTGTLCDSVVAKMNFTCEGGSSSVFKNALNAPLEDHHHASGFARGDAHGPSLLALCDNLRFGPLTRRRLQDACGVQTAVTVGG